MVGMIDSTIETLWEVRPMAIGLGDNAIVGFFLYGDVRNRRMTTFVFGSHLGSSPDVCA